jgi:hypothetical protein
MVASSHSLRGQKLFVAVDSPDCMVGARPLKLIGALPPLSATAAGRRECGLRSPYLAGNHRLDDGRGR